YPIDGPVNGSPAVVGDNVFVAGCDSVLHVVDANTGKAAGPPVDLGGQAGSTGATADDFVYVGTMSNQVVAVNTKTAKKAWEFEAKRRQNPFYASAAVTDKFVVAGSRDKKIYAIDRATGRERWNFAAEGAVDASPVVVGSRVYVGCLSLPGEFTVLDLDTGKVVQNLTLDGAVTGSAAVAGDRLLVGTDKGTLFCFGAK
ncbi:MAG: PQQ-binding-like beta-propeller repeat protein, partial [Fimbriiglobus sp.]